MSANDWVTILLIVVLYSVFAAWFGRFSITMPLVLVVAGAVVGPDALGLINVPATAARAEQVVELTLALLLFADAATLDWREVRQDAELPARLLLIGLPLTVLLGAAMAFGLFPAEKIGFALLIGAILAPTDAALGLPIFTNTRVPSSIRRALNIESGLNDGIATPLVTLFLALAIEEQDTAREGWLAGALTSMGLAVVVGAVVGLIGGWLFSVAVARGWTTTTAQHVGNLALALGVYWASLALGGNGFIAAFVGGLAFGFATRYQLRETTEFTEEAGTALSAFVWIMFGAYFVVPLLRDFEARAFVFALLALTVVRMVPVAISMIGTGLRPDTVLLMGWLGPRGLASVVFLLIAIEALRDSEREITTLAAMAAWTISLSVLLHAVTASPLAERYARRLATAPPDAREFDPHPTMAPYHVLGRHRSLGLHWPHAEQRHSE